MNLRRQASETARRSNGRRGLRPGAGYARAGYAKGLATFAAATLVAALALAACSSSNNSSSSSSKTAGTQTTAASGTTVDVKSGSVGSYLTDSSGRTVYLFANDTGSRSTCTGSCAAIWPPLTTTGTPKAGSGVSAAMLGTTTRDDGSIQVTYNGHPLYYYVSDTSAGQTNGQGLNLNGGLWWVVSPGGSAITGTSTPSPSHS